MDAAPSLETVFQALAALYQNPDVEGKEKASVWLGELQRSVYAWQISDQLLQLNQDVESCYFAAQTMRTKIQYSFAEVPGNSHQSLKDSLLNHASKINQETPPAIATQLCLALADLALLMPTWTGATQEIIQRFSGEGGHLHFLVELLTVLPEEIDSHSLRLGANRRQEIKTDMERNCSTVVQLLTTCLEGCGDDQRLQAKVFRCLGSWFNMSLIPQEEIIHSKLITAPFQVLVDTRTQSHLHEAATDCVSNALYAVELKDAKDFEEKSQLAMSLFDGVLTLPDAYHMSVALEDLDKSVNYCRIFTEMAESFLNVIVMTPNQGFGDFRILELLLTCIGHHQYEVADITFNFWYRLSEHLYQINNLELNHMFRPYVERLLVALCRHCQFDTDHEGIPDQKDEFADFRSRVSELIKDVIFIVGSSTCFAQMFNNLQSQGSDALWDASEAALFIMTAVAKNLDPEEDAIVPQVLQALLHLPDSTHVALRYTSILLVGEIAEWIQKHPEYLDPVLQFLLAGLREEKLACASAAAIQAVSSQCQDSMVNHFSGLLQIVQSMETFKLSNDAAIGLLKGTTFVLTRMPHEEITAGLKQLCAPQVSQLNKILELENTNSIGRNDPTVWLDRLAAIFRHINPNITNGQPHPCQPVIQEVWPVLSRACDKYQADIRIIERCCRCIRFAVRCLGKGSAALLTPLVTQMVNLYQSHQHSCFLYLGSILVDEYGSEEICVQGLLDMLKAFCDPTFRILKEVDGLRNHPDTVDDLFRLCLRFIQRSPVAFLQSDSITLLLCCAIAALSLDHKDANNSVTKFLMEFVKSSRNKEDRGDFQTRHSQVSSMLQEHGSHMVTALLNACIFHLPTYMIGDSCEVFLEIQLFNKQLATQWMQEALKTLPVEGTTGVIVATPQQLDNFQKAVTGTEDLKDLTRIIRDFARLYR